MMLTLRERLSHNLWFAVFLVVVVIIASVAGAVLKSGANGIVGPTYRSKVTGSHPPWRREGFEEKYRSIKNEMYVEHLRPYFSGSGSSSSESDVSFIPSVADVACLTMTLDVAGFVDCSNSRLDSVTIRDENTVNMPGHDSCNSLLVSRQPGNPNDAELRILTGMYRFFKTCVDISFRQLSVVESFGSELSLRMSALDPTATFLLLNRPVFLATDSSHLYAIMYPEKDQQRTYRGLKADASRRVDGAPALVEFRLRRVDNERLLNNPNAKNLHELFDWNAEDADEEEEATEDDSRLRVMHATVYYLRYTSPMRVGTVRMRFDRHAVTTLVFPISTRSLHDENSRWFDSRDHSSPRIRIESVAADRRHRSGEVIVSVGEPNSASSYRIDVKDRGYFVMIYSLDLLILCYMTRDLVEVKRVAGVPTLDIDDPHLFQIRVDEAGARVPPLCHPANTFCLANLYDMYVRLVSYS